MGAPVLVPAAIGAVGSTAMGGSPLKGALLGGGLGYGLGQLGSSGFLSGLTSPAASTPSALLGSTGEIGSSLLSTAGGLGTPLSMADKVVAGLTNLPSTVSNYAMQNPLSTLNTANQLGGMLNPPQTGIEVPPPPPPIRQAAPNVLPGQQNTAGMVNLQSAIAQNPELVRLYPNLLGGR